MNILNMKFSKYFGMQKNPSSPWSKYYNKKNLNIIPPNETIYEYFKRHLKEYPSNIAIEYFNTKITYQDLLSKIDQCAISFLSEGIQPFDVVSIISANLPEAIICFYALNKIGAIANMLHPLLSANEIKKSLQNYGTVMVVAMDITIPKIKDILSETDVYKVIVISPKDSLKSLLRLGYTLKNKKIVIPQNQSFILWKDFLKNNQVPKRKIKFFKDKINQPAAILQSGGTTGKTKGIVLSNGNFNSSTIQAKIALPDLNSHDSVLGIMPLFHGFGLQVSINDALNIGAKVILIPKFQKENFYKLLIKYKPTVLIGVPTLFYSFLNDDNMQNINLDYLKYVIAGGDSFSKEKVNKINEFLHSHGAKTNFTQGYGLTESLAAVSFDLKYNSHAGTIGIPWPGTFIKIVKPGTDEELPFNTDGEICICGPTVMLGYYNNEKETNEVLHQDKNHNIWLHTGDIGSMDEDGFITYKQRLKRIIISSGYNIYPNQIEEILNHHEAVLDSLCLGIPDPYKIEVVKAYIVLKKGYKQTPELEEELLDLCQQKLATYSIPKFFEFRPSLPKTIVGKTDFRKLQEENNKKRKGV